MNVVVYADLNSNKVKQMTEAISQVHWHRLDNPEQLSKTEAEYRLYVLTPAQALQQQIPSCIPSLINDSNKKPENTLYCYLPDEDDQFFTKHQIKSLEAIGKMIQNNGACWLKQLPKDYDQFEQALNSEALS